MSAGRLRPDDVAFVPAALEVMDAPPNPLGRGIALALSAITAAGLAWAWFGSVDIVAVASGKLVARERTQVVQPMETATVSAVLVRPGQRVEAGQPLVELDATAPLAERERARRDLAAAMLDELRLQAFLDDEPTAAFASVPGASEAERQAAQQHLEAQRADRSGQIAALEREKVQKQAELAALNETVAKIAATLPLVAERRTIREQAAGVGGTSLLAKLESEQLVVETESELRISRSRVAAYEAAIAGLEQKIAATRAELRLNALSERDKARDREHAAREALAKSSRRMELMTLRAPISGTIQEMHVTRAGSVLTPAQQVMSIAPDDEHLAVEAVLDNRDVGFVTTGQKVEVKVDAFPFTRHGVLPGTVVSVDRDAEAQPASQAAIQGTDRTADRTDGIEASERLRYVVRVALEAATLASDGKPARLMPGMAVKAEIITGRRRLVDFLFGPAREMLHDSLRER